MSEHYVGKETQNPSQWDEVENAYNTSMNTPPGVEQVDGGINLVEFSGSADDPDIRTLRDLGIRHPVLDPEEDTQDPDESYD